MQSTDFVYVICGPIFKGQSDVINKLRNYCRWLLGLRICVISINTCQVSKHTIWLHTTG
ncbi:hypothetical protein LINPERPRIM_LOCUS24081 [Linum perenne]